MSRGFVSLVKIQLRNVLMSMFGRSKKSGKGTFIMAIIFPAAISMYVSGVYSIALAEVLLPDQMYFIPVLGFVLAVLFSALFTFYSANSLFKSKDYELLCSLPFSKREIFIAKLLSLYAYSYIYVFFFMLIPMGLYFIKVGFDLSILIWSFLQSLCIPFFTIVFSALFAMIIMYITSFFKRKAMIQIILYVLLLVGVFLGSSSLNAINEILIDAEGIISTLKVYAYPIYCFLMSVKMDSMLYALQTIGLLVGLFTIFVLVFSHFFDAINKSLLRTKTGTKIKLSKKSFTTNGVQLALFKRELSRYLQSPIYVMNTIVGPLMLFIGAIAALFQREQLGIVAIYLGGTESMMLLVAVAIVFMLSITTTSNSSISLEGKYIWISKTLPVTTNQLFRSKLLLSILVEYPLSLLSLLVFSFALKLPIQITLLYAIFLLIVSIHSSILGLIINLHYPKLDYLNEAAVVKQSAAVMIFMLCGLLSALVLGGIAYILNDVLNYVVIVGVICIVLVVIEWLEYKYLITKGTRLFANL